MKKFISILLTVFVIISSIFIFSGCGNGLNASYCEPQNIAFVIGNHKYFPKLSMNIQSIYDAIFDACFSYGSVSTFISDGESYLAGDYTITAPDVNIDNSKRKQIAKNNTNQIISECSQAKAIAPEIDTLSALIKAGDSLVSSSGIKTLNIYDSGLSTAGLLNFASQNLIDADPNLIVEQLIEYNAIPRLEGVDVVWTGLGQTCGEQKQLQPSYKTKLENIYTAILKAGGAANVTFNREPIPNVENTDDLPYCSIVPVVEDVLDFDTVVPDIVKFDQEKISFVPDSDKFLDETIAHEALQPLAEALNKDTSLHVIIVGSTATDGTLEGCKRLSLQRAERVKTALIEEFGVNASQLQTYGAGQESTPLRVNDLKDGRLVESEAAKNRAVYIINTESDLADHFS